MKRATIISISLIILGFGFECLHFLTDIHFLEIKFWLLGIISMTLGVCGVLWFLVVPILEKRASTLGKIKKNKFNR